MGVVIEFVFSKTKIPLDLNDTLFDFLFGLHQVSSFQQNQKSKPKAIKKSTNPKLAKKAQTPNASFFFLLLLLKIPNTIPPSNPIPIPKSLIFNLQSAIIHLQWTSKLKSLSYPFSHFSHFSHFHFLSIFISFSVF